MDPGQGLSQGRGFLQRLLEVSDTIDASLRHHLQAIQLTAKPLEMVCQFSLLGCLLIRFGHLLGLGAIKDTDLFSLAFDLPSQLGLVSGSALFFETHDLVVELAESALQQRGRVAKCSTHKNCTSTPHCCASRAS